MSVLHGTVRREGEWATRYCEEGGCVQQGTVRREGEWVTWCCEEGG